VTRPFGEADGTPVHEAVLRGRSGAEARVLSYGAILRDLVVPAPNGPRRVVLGFERLEDYRAHASAYLGVIAGRYANRIAHGAFTVDGVACRIPADDGGHALHGGPRGFGERVWTLTAAAQDAVTLTLLSPDGDNGFPGTLAVACTYRLLEPATLRVEITAVVDRPSPVGLCHHSYFNLDGAADIRGHRLAVAADFYTPVDAELIPTGDIRAVAGTPFDFRAERPVGADAPLDLNFVLRRAGLAPGALARAARLVSPASGLALSVRTTEPGLQVYDGAKLAVPVSGLGGARYGAHAGICLEPQRFPDAPNRSHFPDAVLRPGAVYRQVTEYRFEAA
jgi:aldose 1-epimerase